LYTVRFELNGVNLKADSTAVY